MSDGSGLNPGTIGLDGIVLGGVVVVAALWVRDGSKYLLIFR